MVDEDMKLLAVCAVGGCHPRDRQDSTAPAAVTDAGATPVGALPEIELADLDRLHAILAQHRGHAVFVNFWATWCGPCTQELPDLAGLAREEERGGTSFVGVSLDAWVTGEGSETQERVRRALAEGRVTYPNVIYKGDQDPLLQAFPMSGALPFSLLYDAQGTQVKAWEGAAPIPAVRQAIATMRGQPPDSTSGR